MIIRYLNRHPKVAKLVLSTGLLVARASGVHADLLRRTRELAASRQFEYAAGFLAWFTLFRFNRKLPTFNIYHLVSPDEHDLVASLLAERLDNYRVAKQYYLLRSETGLEDDFLESVRSFLENGMNSPGSNTSTKRRKFDTREAFVALCDMDDLLKARGLKPFLVSGTLLGIVRDNALIEGDNDLDIGVFAGEASSEQVCNLLRGERILDSVYNLGHLVQATHRNGTVIDIFIHYEQDGAVWHGTDVHKWTNSPFELSDTVVQAHTFFIPSEPERYLDENYGDWKRPVLFWDYSFDTPNRDFFPVKKTVYYLAERILGELRKPQPSRHAVQTAVTELKNRFDIDLTEYLGNAPAAAPPKADRGKVVVTFGTFDLFHIGHLNILERAAALGDRLIVGVSSDAMNYGKKKTYPVYCQEDRIRIVKSVSYVDDVFFEESMDLKRHYLEQHQADVLVMGDDWRGKFDDLSDICDVVYLSRTENISTSETKDAIRNNL